MRTGLPSPAGEMGYHLGSGRMLSCASSGMNSAPLSAKVVGMEMDLLDMFNTAYVEEPLCESGWDQVAPLSHIENSKASSVMFFPSDYANSYRSLMGNLGAEGTTPLGATGSPNFISGGKKVCIDDVQGQGDCLRLEEQAVEESPDGKWRASDPPFPVKINENAYGDMVSKTSMQKELSEKMEHTANMKQTIKQLKVSSRGRDPNAESIHVRAKRGQATNSHSLAERVRREKISERMRVLKELVPGCNKITGKAVMLDEIINYVQSLQRQVEFLSMKLATVNPELNIEVERILSKDVLCSSGCGAPIESLSLGMSPSHPYSQGFVQGSPFAVPNTTPLYNAMPQGSWDGHVQQNLLHMGFNTNSTVADMAPDGSSKMEI